MSEITFFTEFDYTKEGKISSEYPAWFFDTLTEELREDIRMAETAIEQGHIPVPHLAEAKESLKRNKERLNAMVEGRPKLSEVDENKLHRVVEDMGKEISRLLFTDSEMRTGRKISAHEEVRRKITPSISISPEAFKFAIAAKVSVTEDRKISRDGAAKLWKIGRKYFGESSNIEELRKP